MSDNKYMRAKEVAKYLGIGASTVWHYVKIGKLKAKKISPRVTVFLKSDLDEFVNG
jgi:excisionase family DNA binding protein